jgi:hypothetical protein
MRARIFESFPLAPFRISGTHAPRYYPHGVASSTLRYYPSTEPITAPRKPIDQRPRPMPDQSSDVDRPLYKRNVHPGQFPPHKQEKHFKQTQQNLNIQTNYKTSDHVRS